MKLTNNKSSNTDNTNIGEGAIARCNRSFFWHIILLIE